MTLSNAGKDLSEDRRLYFIQVLKEVMEKNSWPQRKLCEELGITIGTLTKYLRGSVDPFSVGSSKLRKLAAIKGVTTDTLLNYLETGQYTDRLTIDDVASWIRSSSVQEHLPTLLDALSDAQKNGTVPVVEARRTPVGHYTDAHAERFQSIVKGAMDALKAQGMSTLKAWSVIEGAVATKFPPEEIDTIYDLVTGGITLTAEIMNPRSVQLAEKYPNGCPLVEGLLSIDALKDYEPLQTVKSWELIAAI